MRMVLEETAKLYYTTGSYVKSASTLPKIHHLSI